MKTELPIRIQNIIEIDCNKISEWKNILSEIRTRVNSYLYSSFLPQKSLEEFYKRNAESFLVKFDNRDIDFDSSFDNALSKIERILLTMKDTIKHNSLLQFFLVSTLAFSIFYCHVLVGVFLIFIALYGILDMAILQQIEENREIMHEYEAAREQLREYCSLPAFVDIRGNEYLSIDKRY